MARGAFMKRPGQNVQVPTNAPFGGSQGTAIAKAHGMRPASQPAPNTTGTPAPASVPVPAPQVPVKPAPKPKPPAQPAERVEPPPGNAPAPRGGGGSGGNGLILGLGVGLIVVNAVFGNNSGSLLSSIWYKPDQQSATPPQNNLFPIIGEIIFLVILAMLARFSDTSRQLVLTFLIGLWLLWLMFRFPAVYKAGIAGTVGQFFSQGPMSSSGTSSSTSQPSSQPVAQSQTSRLIALNQGGSLVGNIPHHSLIMG